MKTMILGLLAETPIHPGAGQDTGFVDLPVAREAATDYPVIVGSSFKGALLNHARDNGLEEAKRDQVFGKQDRAGALLVSDVRLVLLPVRSLTSHYKWVTCPHLLERLKRDLSRAGCDGAGFSMPNVERGKFLGAGEASLYLEERNFAKSGDVTEELTALLEKLIAHAETQARIPRQLVILHDDDFAWFARFGLAVQARNVLDDEKKTSQNLWYEECIPPDSLFYALLADRNGGTALETIAALLDNRPYVQVGGNETIGQGWLAVRKWEGGDA
ncbi:MAG: type III-B CRISPR module RAMP protein Cmr4 [Planctomycetota bacterium]|nr:MAG: type III-B CRISPR module RAMP protein Cmr4 [Planctomycetota bacterium]